GDEDGERARLPEGRGGEGDRRGGEHLRRERREARRRGMREAPVGDETRKRIAAEQARWREQTWGRATKKHPERRERFETSSGIELPPLVGPADVAPEEGY